VNGVTGENNMDKQAYEDIQNYKSNCINAKEVGQRLKTLGNEECTELIRICKAFDCVEYELTHSGGEGDEWLITCKKINKTTAQRRWELLKRLWRTYPQTIFSMIFNFRFSSYLESAAKEENDKLRAELKELREGK
jgi:hypothetical protein